MLVRKAVITAASPNQHTLPLQHLVDRDGKEKTALQLVIEETVAAGIEELCVVIQPGDAYAYERAAGDQAGQLRFVVQPEPRGYGDALYQAREFVAGEAFLHLVGDHLYISRNGTACAKQLVDVATEFKCPVSAVQATREHKLPFYGVVSGTNVPRRPHVYEVNNVLEKPTPTQAEQELLTPGLRSGYYLCFFGMHVLTQAVMDALGELLPSSEQRQDAGADRDAAKTVTLADAIAQASQRGRFLATQINGTRYNLGEKYGLLVTQLALALSGRDRDEILTEMIELLAGRPEEGNQA